jgi:MFS family permease
VAQHRNIRLLMVFNFLLDFRFYTPVAILYFAQVTGSFASGMMIFSIIMLAAALWEVPTGILSDQVGRKRTVILGAAASTAAIVFYAIGGSFAALAIGGVLEGLSRALYSGNNDALLYDTLAEQDLEHQFAEYSGRTRSMFQLAAAIAAIIGSLLAFISYPLVMWLSVVPQALNIGVSFFFYEPTHHAAIQQHPFAHLRESLRLVLANPRLRLLTVAGALSGSIGEASFQFRSAFIQTLWPVWAIGVARMIAHGLGAFGFYFAGRFIRRFGEYRLLVGGITLSEFVNFVSLLFPTVLSPLFMSANSIFYGINSTASDALMQHEFTTEQRATMGSITSFATSVLFAIAAPLIGAMADAWGARTALLIVTVVSVVWIYTYARALGTKSKRGVVLDGV